MNVKAFNLMSKVNETGFSIHDECWCESKESDDGSSGIDDFMWNLSTCGCQCNKACKIRWI